MDAIVITYVTMTLGLEAKYYSSINLNIGRSPDYQMIHPHVTVIYHIITPIFLNKFACVLT